MAMRLPGGIGSETGAALPVVYTTAVIALTETVSLRDGDWVLVFAATGGSVSRPCRWPGRSARGVIALATGAEKQAVARAEGADIVIPSDAPRSRRTGQGGDRRGGGRNGRRSGRRRGHRARPRLPRLARRDPDRRVPERRGREDPGPSPAAQGGVGPGRLLGPRARPRAGRTDLRPGAGNGCKRADPAARRQPLHAGRPAARAAGTRAAQNGGQAGARPLIRLERTDRTVFRLPRAKGATGAVGPDRSRVSLRESCLRYASESATCTSCKCALPPTHSRTSRRTSGKNDPSHCTCALTPALLLRSQVHPRVHCIHRRLEMQCQN